MRLTIIRDDRGKWRGLGVVWDGPLNLNAYNRHGKLLAVLLDYTGRNEREMSLVLREVPRELLPVCEECRIHRAELWCKDHAHYVCVDCVALAAAHTVCRLESIAVKKAESAVVGAK